MKKNRQKINEVFSDAFTGSGIFNALQSFPVPWAIENISESLDLEYFGNISGEKYISPLVDKVKSGYTLTDTEINKLAKVIYSMYGNNWIREYNTMFEEYNPIENYSMVEKMTNDTTVDEYGRNHTRTDNLSLKKTGTVEDSLSKTGTETQAPNVTVNDSNSVYGFNSSAAVPSSSGSNSTTGTDTKTYNTTDANTTTYNTTDANTGTVQDADTGSDTHTRNYQLTRSGNIGVTTSQQMIQSERELYMWNFFYNVVFPDIDKILTINIY